MSRRRRWFLGLVAIGILLLLALFVRSSNTRRVISIDEFWTLIDGNHVVGTMTLRQRSTEGKIDPDSPFHSTDQPNTFLVHYGFTDPGFFERLHERLRQHNPPYATTRIEVEKRWWERILP